MDVCNLPPEIQVYVLRHFCAEELILAGQVSKKWRTVTAHNKVWWILCMNAWYDPENRPNQMEARDKKRDWKKQYLSITGLKPAPIDRPKKEKVKKVWEELVETKQTSREFYKGLRNKKPKCKDHHVTKSFTATLVGD